MFITRMAIASAAAAGLLCLAHPASAGPAANGQAAFASQSAPVDSQAAVIPVAERNEDRHRLRGHYRRGRVANHGYDGHRRNEGPPYSRCYMQCINSSHPADFCRDVSEDHFCY